MTNWSEWEIIRRRVAIGGRVTDEHGEPVPGAEVTITSLPDSFKAKVGTAGAAKGWECQEGDKRPDCTVARSDGVFFFLDLPEGRFTVTATERRSGRKAEKSVKVSLEDGDRIKMAHAELRLTA